MYSNRIPLRVAESKRHITFVERMAHYRGTVIFPLGAGTAVLVAEPYEHYVIVVGR